MAKDVELKAALAKVTNLEKALQDHDRAITRERHGTLLEAQHLDETFASKCFLWILPGWNAGFFALVTDLSCSSF